MELALRSLHEAAGDEAAALQSLHIARRDRFQWSKADQRKFGQELAKDAVDLIALRRNIGWKEMKWVVRYFYVEEGPRKRAKHDKQRELEDLKYARSQTPISLSVARGAGMVQSSSTHDGADDV